VSIIVNCKLHLLGVVKATVINCEPSAAVLGVNFDEMEMARCLSMAARFELAAIRGGSLTCAHRQVVNKSSNGFEDLLIDIFLRFARGLKLPFGHAQ
jgi:hypothetical protein